MNRVNPTLWGAYYGHVHLKATSLGLHTTRQKLCAYFKKQCAKKIALSYTFTKLNQETYRDAAQIQQCLATNVRESASKTRMGGLGSDLNPAQAF
jgi:hypothetical protein